MYKRPNKLERAFTLIEILVVMAIIAVLVALLMPALKTARTRAKSVACLSDLHQQGIGWFRYVTDNQMQNVAYGWEGICSVSYGAGLKGSWMGAFFERALPQDPYRSCPEAPFLGSSAPGPGSGGAFKAWYTDMVPDCTLWGSSYGINSYLFRDQAWGEGLGTHYVNATTISQPSRTPLILDANWVDGVPQPSDGFCRQMQPARAPRAYSVSVSTGILWGLTFRTVTARPGGHRP